MAERRMFAKSIIDSDAFIEMPMSARLLYYDLSMRADDDGFVNAPRKIMKFVGASIDDMNILIARKFVISFDNGVVVIKHWRIHNYIQTDRYKETNYKEQKAMLTLDENKAYKLQKDECIQNVYRSDTQVSIGKDIDSIGYINKEDTQRKRFVKPTLEEVRDYCNERRNIVNPEHFMDYYESNGWKVGKNPMKDWKATVRSWETREKKETRNVPNFENRSGEGVSKSYDELIKEIGL